MLDIRQQFGQGWYDSRIERMVDRRQIIAAEGDRYDPTSRQTDRTAIYPDWPLTLKDYQKAIESQFVKGIDFDRLARCAAIESRSQSVREFRQNR